MKVCYYYKQRFPDKRVTASLHDALLSPVSDIMDYWVGTDKRHARGWQRSRIIPNTLT
jgi:hypothetical protein